MTLPGDVGLVVLLDALIAGVALEALALLLWRRRSGTGMPATEWLPTLLAGVGVMLAWRAAAVGGGGHGPGRIGLCG